MAGRRLWWLVVGFMAAMWVLFGLLWALDSELRNIVVYQATEAVAIAAIVLGVRRYRPSAPAAWLLIAGCLATWLVADVIWAVYVVQDRAPFPSPADFFYLAGYPLIGAGLVIAIRRRGAAVDARAWLDAGMIAGVAALVAWVYLAQPTIDDPSLSTWQKCVLIGYPTGDMLVLLVAARFVMGLDRRVRSLEFLVLGLAFTLVGDVLFQISVTDRPAAVYNGDWLLLAGVVLIGAAGLHETMPALTEDSSDPLREGFERQRVFLLAAACVVPLVVLAVEHARGKSPPTAPYIASMGLLALLAVIRSDIVARRAIWSARRESVLSDYAHELLRSEGEDELCAVAARTASVLVDGGAADVVSAPAVESGASPELFTASVAVRGEHVAQLVAHGTPLTIRRAGPSLETVADELSMALEREKLLESERRAAAALEDRNEQLLELDRMKDQFVSTVTHELRTPLTSMVGYLEMLSGSEVGELTADEQRSFIEIVDRNCKRLTRLVDDILTAARIDSGRFSLERSDVDLATLASERVESIRPVARQKQVDVSLTVEQPLPPLYADGMRLGQLLDNLLSNAVKFTPEGGVVGVKVTTSGEAVRIDVADSGVGIPDDEVDKLFDRFFRASTAASVQGTGLGLSIAKTIAEAHGGTISLESQVGVGTTFSVELPVHGQSDAGAMLSAMEAAR
jgi:signal transduction histidine kinase